MIYNALGLTLNVITIGITSLWVAIVLISILTSFGLRYFNSFDAGIRARLLWSVVLLPWGVAVASIFLLIGPEIFQYRLDWLRSIVHLHHAYAFQIASWHGVLLMIFSGTFLAVSITKFAAALKTSSRLSQLQYFSVSEELNDGIQLIDIESPQAFTAGLFYPRTYITKGLRDVLSEDSFTVVRQHEMAHRLRRDPLRKYTFSLLALFFPKSIGINLNQAFSLSLEQLADQYALKSVGDKTLVSKTILNVARLNTLHDSPTRLSIGACGFTSNSLQLRIRYLLDGDPIMPFPLANLLLFTVAMISVCTLSVDFIHHTMERLFSH